MKVGTDSVLLGTIAEPSNRPKRILDIGTGCGILALMMAQRFPDATIDAIDIDSTSIAIASNNASMSPWAERVCCHPCSLQDFAENNSTRYDLIISNPPYFSNSLRNNDSQKRLARHDDALPPDILFDCSKRLLRNQGEMWIILPCSEKEKFSNAANSVGMAIERIIYIRTSAGKEPTLCIHSLSLRKVNTPSINTFNVREENNQYTAWYRQLTEPFLL